MSHTGSVSQNCVRSTFAVLPLTGLMCLYFIFYISVSLLPAWPQLASFPDRGMACRLLLLLAGLLLRVLTDRGPKLILINRYSASLQGHACYPPINKDVPKMGKNKAPVLASTVTTWLGCLC